MKTQEQHKRLKNSLIIYSGFMIALVFIFASCTEVIQPSKTKVRTLTVQGRVKDCTTGLPSAPAVNAKVKIYKYISETEKSLLDSVYTDYSGLGKYVNEGPVAGFTVKVIGEYQNQYKTTTPRAEFLFCNDTTVTLDFECTPPPNVCCNELTDTTFFVKFSNGIDNNLVQNSPNGIARYDADLTLFCNKLNCNPNYDYTVEVSLPQYPFSVAALYVNGIQSNNPVIVKPGECLSAQFSVSTKTLGNFNDKAEFKITCNGKTNNFVVILNATVVPEVCNCPRKADTVVFKTTNPDKVPVGLSQNYAISLFQNNYQCKMFVTSVTRTTNGQNTSATSAGQWQLVSPPLQTTVNPSESYTPTFRFTPSKKGDLIDTFLVSVRLENGNVCQFYLVTKGFGCFNLCPLINDVPFSNTPINLTGEAAFAPDELCPPKVNISYTYNFPIKIKMPGDACNSPMTLNVTLTGKDQYDGARFNYSSSILVDSIFATDLGAIFVAPSVAKFNAMFVGQGGTRTQTGTREDSAFNATLVITSTDGTCRQVINLKGYVNPSGKLSIPWSLDAYSQTTTAKPTPDYQTVKVDTLLPFAGADRPGFVYQLRDNNYQPLCGKGALPCWGSFYVEVDNPNGEGTVANPKPPKIYLVNNGSNVFTDIKIMASNYSEENFDQLSPILNQLQSIANVPSTGAFFTSNASTRPVRPPNGLTPVSIGDVYAIYSSTKNSEGLPCEIGLIYIRKVFSYGGFSSNNRSNIEFRLIYPVYIHK